MSQENVLRNAFSALAGKPAWGLARSYGSMFFLEIGEPLPRSGEKKVHGKWHFLIEMCQWRIETPEGIVIGSDDEQEFIDGSFSRLELGSVRAANAPSPCHDLEIFFSSGALLRTFMATAQAAPDCTQWQLFLPDEGVCMVTGAGNLLCKNAHT